MDQKPTAAAPKRSPHSQSATTIIIAMLVVVFLVFLLYVAKPVRPGRSAAPARRVPVARQVQPPSSPKVEINDTALASALLTVVDVGATPVVATAAPGLIELNDNLDPTLPDGSLFYVAREWHNPVNGSTWFVNALTKYASSETAKAGIEKLSQDFSRIEIKGEPVGDSMIAYIQPTQGNIPGGLSIRFTVAGLAGKVQMMTASTSAATDTMLVPLYDLAKAQADKLRGLAAKGAMDFPPATNALKFTPKSLAGFRYIGSVPVTSLEWMGVAIEKDKSKTPQFITGALSRFNFNTRPGEVAEVIVMEFATADEATAFRNDLIAEALRENIGLPLPLPAELDGVADAVEQESMLELQAALGTYVVDVNVFSPFGEINKFVAKEDLIKISQEVVNNFFAPAVGK
ncbi:MAG: hypothetical protein HY984_02470 [Candidatus Magasanikbacteria bacterium]|nr:hypothetical protein [Candidatus Magasanikbacteria bacterium]